MMLFKNPLSEMEVDFATKIISNFARVAITLNRYFNFINPPALIIDPNKEDFYGANTYVRYFPNEVEVSIEIGMGYFWGDSTPLENLIAVMAHEMGHAKSALLKLNLQNHAEEFYADEESIKALYFSGFDPIYAISVLMDHSKKDGGMDLNYCTKFHPAAIVRINKMKEIIKKMAPLT